MSAPHELDRLVQRLDAASHDPELRYMRPFRSFGEILREIRFHARVRYWQFTPTYAHDFESRLLAWLTNPGINTSDQQTLLRLVPELQFIDRDDMAALYRTAYTQQLRRWLFDQLRLNFTYREIEIRRAIAEALHHTWLCPITDSMDIAQFCHINAIRTKGYRPQWHTLRQFASPLKVRRFLRRHNLTRIVLLEDFVGSGDQVRPALQFVHDILPTTSVLFAPLIISQTGYANAARLTASWPRFTVAPTFVIPKSVHVCRNTTPNEAPFVPLARSVILRTAHRFRHHAFGYRGLGTLVVSYANCPDNTPPLFWAHDQTWTGLFPRVTRPAD